MKTIQKGLMAFCFVATLAMAGCQTSTRSAGRDSAATAGANRLAPQRVDIRGSIIRSRYSQGEVMLEVEGLPAQQNTRYSRGYVLVEPITQIIGLDGNSISLSELQQGQNVAILLRGGGNGTFVGVGVARKVWVEEAF